MVLVEIGSILAWKRCSSAHWKRFRIGAAIWAVAVVLKLTRAVLLNRPVLSSLKALLPHPVYLAAGSVYAGLLTGVSGRRRRSHV